MNKKFDPALVGNEKLIDGVLHYALLTKKVTNGAEILSFSLSSPVYIPYTIETLTERYLLVKNELSDLQWQVETSRT